MTRTYIYQETNVVETADGKAHDEEIWVDDKSEHEPVLMWRTIRGWEAFERDSGDRTYLSEREHEVARKDGFTC
jgi:hypothetical protein